MELKFDHSKGIDHIFRVKKSKIEWSVKFRTTKFMYVCKMPVLAQWTLSPPIWNSI